MIITKRGFFVVYIAIIHIAIAVVIIYPSIISKIYYNLDIAERPLTGHQYYITKSWDYFATRSETLNPESNQIVFIGNSIVNGLCVESIFKAINFGIAGEKISNAKDKVKKLKNLSNKRIVLTYGINDIPNENVNILNDLKILISNLPETSYIYISSVLPIHEKTYSENWKQLKTNKQIIGLNDLFFVFSQTNERIIFLNTAKYLLDSAGQLDRDLQQGDGIHLNSRGQLLWAKAIAEELNNHEKSINIKNIIEERDCCK